MDWVDNVLMNGVEDGVTKMVVRGIEYVEKAGFGDAMVVERENFDE